jgi:hypothetical protein
LNRRRWPRFAARASFTRLTWPDETLRSRTTSGVTSMHWSSCRNSRLVQRQLARRHEPYTISSSVDAVVGCSSPVPRVSVGGTSRSSGGLSESSEVRGINDAWLAVSRHGSAVPSFRCGSWMVPGVRAVGIGERKFRPRERM